MTVQEHKQEIAKLTDKFAIDTYLENITDIKTPKSLKEIVSYANLVKKILNPVKKPKKSKLIDNQTTFLLDK